MAKKTEKLFAYEAFMEQARKEGRVRNEELSMKVLKPDLSLQARVNHIDKDHVRALHEILKNGQPLAPIIVFEIETGKFKIADGFHRHEVYKREGSLGIPCLVVKGTLQEAIEYAASCNQALSLPRSREDAKKAVFMLFDNGWINRSCSYVASHAGVGQASASKWAAEYCAIKGMDQPQVKIDKNGRLKKTMESGSIAFSSRSRSRYVVNINGTAHRGTDPEKLSTTVKEFEEARETRRKHISVRLHEILARSGIHFLAGESGIARMIRGGATARHAVTSIVDDNTSSQAFLQSMISAIGRVTILAEHFKVPGKSILVADPIEGHDGFIDIARRLGIEFMTLEQFVEAVKADEGEAGAAVAV